MTDLAHADMNVANAILSQLGGNKFLAMTGAKNLIGGSRSLSFKIGNNALRISHVRITLGADDLYRMEFLKIRLPASSKLVHEADGVFADQLQTVFTEVTGLLTRL